MDITIPAGAAELITALEQAGYQAYVVGGCVRDRLLGFNPQDWDICTSAQPSQVMACLSGYPVIASGLQHGTVTVKAGGQCYEITTFRRDGSYRDHRHPDQVEFIGSLREDLARRDFTINAMAYHPERGLADYDGGLADLAARRIRAVGEADCRFREDALRMMRALRFAATFSFTIEEETAQSIRGNQELLRQIAAERLRVELVKLLSGAGAAAVLRDFGGVIGVFMPEILPMVGFGQHNPYHHLDVWQHTLMAVSLAPCDEAVRLALFFHDIGKPHCFEIGADGAAHFYGHAQIGAKLAKSIMRRLRFDNATISRVGELVFYHDAEIPAREKSVRRWLNKLGETQLRRLVELKKADSLAHRLETQTEKLQNLEALSACIDAVIESGQCFTLPQLALDGHDIVALGVPRGAAVGQILRELLQMVIDGQAPNEAEALLKAARGLAAALRREDSV